MDKKQKLEELQNKYEELMEDLSALKAENEIMVSAIEVNKGLNEKIANLESKLETNKQYIKSLQRKIKTQETKIRKLKDTEEYKNGDEATLLKVEEMELALNANLEMKDNVDAKIKSIESDLELVKTQKQQLIYIYGEEIDQPLQAEVPEIPEENKVSEEKVDDNIAKDNKGKDNKQAYTKMSSGATGVVAEAPEEDEGEKAKREQEEKEAQLQADFKELYSKAKRGALTDSDFDKFSVIMKDPENYNKLGITTGIVFNKAKVIFKAMSKTASISGLTLKNADEKLDVELAKANEIVKQNRDNLSEEKQIEWDNAEKHIKQYNDLKASMKVCAEVSKKRMQEKWSWLFEFESDSKPALAEATAIKVDASKNEFSKKLAEQTNTEPEYDTISTSSRKIEEQEQTK